MTQTTATGFPKIRISQTADQLLRELDAARRRKHVLIIHSSCAAPSVVRAVPDSDFRAGPTQARVTTVSGHAVWADQAELRTCPHRSLIIVPTSAHLGRLRLIARAYDPEGGRRP